MLPSRRSPEAAQASRDTAHMLLCTAEEQAGVPVDRQKLSHPRERCVDSSKRWLLHNEGVSAADLFSCTGQHMQALAITTRTVRSKTLNRLPIRAQSHMTSSQMK